MAWMLQASRFWPPASKQAWARWLSDGSPEAGVKDRPEFVRQRKADRNATRARTQARVENRRVGVGRIQAPVTLSN
ncbi:hypothetical protein BDI4_290074 [Burkholderia diffusa]|nr:hypothetical protein BDI4_290074 [Burkholderia diffusa]